MTIRTADLNQALISRMWDRVVELIGEEDFAVRRPAWPRDGALDLTLPHYVYGLDPQLLAAHAPLGEAEPVAARVLVRINGVLVACAELALDAEAEVAVNDGPFVQSTVRALNLLEATAGHRDGELRVFRASPLQLMAAWLHADDGDDQVVPMSPAPDDLEAERSYPTDITAERLAALAQRYLDMPDVTEG